MGSRLARTTIAPLSKYSGRSGNFMNFFIGATPFWYLAARAYSHLPPSSRFRQAKHLQQKQTVHRLCSRQTQHRTDLFPPYVFLTPSRAKLPPCPNLLYLRNARFASPSFLSYSSVQPDIAARRPLLFFSGIESAPTGWTKAHRYTRVSQDSISATEYLSAG